jgi:hypothetical protein
VTTGLALRPRIYRILDFCSVRVKGITPGDVLPLHASKTLYVASFFVDIQYIGLIYYSKCAENRTTLLPKRMQRGGLGKVHREI